jgi:hypothetical protein
MVCTEVPNQIKFVSRPHPTGSRTDFIYTAFEPEPHANYFSPDLNYLCCVGLWIVAAMLPSSHVAISPAPLHHYMTQAELHYYFGTTQPRYSHRDSILYPLHHYMTQAELHYYFGTTQPRYKNRDSILYPSTPT